MTQEKLIELLSGMVYIHDARKLIYDLKECDEELLFETLFPIAIKRQGTTDISVAFSAVILYALNPACRISLTDAITALITDWDASIEEVPWYLVNQFGADEVIMEAESLAGTLIERTDEIARARLEAICYWARIKQNMK